MKAAASWHVHALHHRKGAADGAAWEVRGHNVFKAERPSTGWPITPRRLEAFHQAGKLNQIFTAPTRR